MLLNSTVGANTCKCGLHFVAFLVFECRFTELSLQLKLSIQSLIQTFTDKGLSLIFQVP